jgi:hypothetical protein
MRIIDLVSAKAHECGSSFIHELPEHRRRQIARKIFGLNLHGAATPDRLLRWRVAELCIDPDADGNWAHADFPPKKPSRWGQPASQHKFSGWINKVLMVRRHEIEALRTDNAVPAIAYRHAGAIALVGVNELPSAGPNLRSVFLRPVMPDGRPSKPGMYCDHYGVAVRVGPAGMDAVLGVANLNRDGRHIQTVPTQFGTFNINGAIPRGLLRV